MNKFTKSNFIKLSNDALNFQLSTIYPVKIKNEPERFNLVFLNHDRNFSTFLTIKYLFEHGRVADIYTLSRSMFESVISMGLIANKIIKNDLERYQTYQFTEIFKTHSHLKKLGLERTSALSQKEFKFIKKKRDEYINKYGKKLSSWTGESFEQNVKLVDTRVPPTCNENHFYEYLYCQVYREGSQSTHSSFAGISKGIEVERVEVPGLFSAQRLKPNESHLIFSCFHNLIVFLSSVRFIGYLLKKKETEDYFHKITKYIIPEN